MQEDFSRVMGLEVECKKTKKLKMNGVELEVSGIDWDLSI